MRQLVEATYMQLMFTMVLHALLLAHMTTIGLLIKLYLTLPYPIPSHPILSYPVNAAYVHSLRSSMCKPGLPLTLARKQNYQLPERLYWHQSS